MSLSPASLSIQAGQAQNFTATVQNDAQNKGVTWTLSGPGCNGAACGKLSDQSSGSGTPITYAAPATVPNPATVTLTATSVTDITKSAAAVITVIAPPPPVSVSISSGSSSIQTGQTQAFSATVQNDPQNKGVTWTLSGAGCTGSACGTLSASSATSTTYTAPSTVPNPSSVTLTATSVADSTKSAAATITVTAPPPPVTVSISPASVSLQTGQKQAFTATVLNDPQNKGVTWALSGAGCTGASCGTLSGTSSTSTTYTAPATVPNPATVTLTATSAADSTKSSVANITITAPPPPVSVGVAPTSASVQTGQTQSFTAIVQNDPQNKGVTWTLSGAGCTGAACGTLSASSSASGTPVTYTAPNTVRNPATVTLTATPIADATKSAAANITVTAPPPSVSVAPTSASVQTGQTQSFTATVQNDPQNKGVTWMLSGAGCTGAACGTLSASSSASGTPVTYTAPNTVPNPATVTLTATPVADNTKSSVASITVTAPPVSVSVAPTSSSVQTGQTQSFTAIVQNDPQNKGVTWTVSGAGCTGAACGTLSASSSASGTPVTYTAPSTVPNPATVTLTATSVADNSKTGIASVTITAPPVVSVSVAPASQSVVIGQTQAFTATVQNDPQTKGVTWALSGAGCASVTCGTLSNMTPTSTTYTAPAIAPTPATVTLTATSVADGTKSAAASITVTTAPSNVSVTISPKRGGLTVSQTLNFTATVQNDVNNQGVKWSASGGTFPTSTSTSAVYQAPNRAGVYTITATSIADGTKSASAVIGVTDLSGVSTYHNNLSRDGANSQEYALTPSNVSSTTFGKLFSCPVDAPVYPQPLWLPNVAITNKGTHNVIIVATENDSVYAFDADATPCGVLWHDNLIPAGEVAPSISSIGGDDFVTSIGIVGTPVIDLASQVIYLVTKTETKTIGCSASGGCHQRLHALSLLDGTEKMGGPVEITSAITVSGTGNGSSGGQLPFNPWRENQRPGLALVNNTVYVGWASHYDQPPWHGWLMGFNKTNLTAPPITYVTTPNGNGGGIWMGGGAPAVDANNNLYVITGNGNWDGINEFGDTMLKLSASLSLQDWLTPSNQSTLDGSNNDFGAGGATILVDLPSTSPVQHLLIGGGKNQELYVVNRDNMGHLENASNVVQKFSVGSLIFSTGAFWQNTFYIAGGAQYDNGGFSGPGLPVQAFKLNPSTSTFNTTPSSSSSTAYPERGATPSVSSSGSLNGIVWAIDASAWGSSTGGYGTGPAVLHAYDATNLNNELWNSSQASRDQAGNAVKFTVPTVANGKVYIGTTSELDVYGLLPN